MRQVAEAKNRVSELIPKALTEGPPPVRRRGETAAVSAAERGRLAGAPKPKTTRGAPKTTRGECLLNALSCEGADLSRDQDAGREGNLDFDDDA